MKAVVQRVARASVTIDGNCCSEIEQGLLVLLGVEQDDDVSKAEKLAAKLLKFRIFSDQDGKMNWNISDVGGSLLVVSQFTLAATTGQGNRPGFSSAAAPVLAESLYEHFVTVLRRADAVPVKTGVFAADMQVSLLNDGPVTFTFDV
jgi:D-tyrosyl-tRNA(Tyr) deacylase|tara:strand:- start:120228 stop:120668 length:441 start_codon:yes stop_codon:yes gene_type:complete